MSAKRTEARNISNDAASDMDPNGIGLAKNTNILTHRVVLSLRTKGTLKGYQMTGPTAACMGIDPTRALETFAHPSMPLVTSEDRSKAMNAIRNANLKKVEVLQTANTFPTETGVSINLIPKCEAVENGEKFSFTTLPNQVVNTPATIFQSTGSEANSREWQTKFSAWSADNLDSHGVLQVPKCPYVFVHKEHPVISVIRHNQDSLGIDLDKTETMDDLWCVLCFMYLDVFSLCLHCFAFP